MAAQFEQSGSHCQPTTFSNGADNGSGHVSDHHPGETEPTESIKKPDSQGSTPMDLDNPGLQEPAIEESDLKFLGTYKPTHIIACYSSDHNNKHTLYLGIIEEPGKESTYQWEKDLLYDFDLILEFEKEIQKRKMPTTWPFPGYKWRGPGTYDYFVEEVLEDGIEFSLPKFPKDLQHCQEKLIWYRYSVPYLVLLVDQVNQMLLSTPTSTPEQPLVPLDHYENVWKELKSTLRDYLRVHFTEHPQGHSFDMLENKCADIIEAVANQVQKIPRNWDMIRGEIRKAANLVTPFHEENSLVFLKRDGKCDDKYMSSVTIQRIDPSTSVSSGSKTNTEEVDKRTMREKEEAKKKEMAKERFEKR